MTEKLGLDLEAAQVGGESRRLMLIPATPRHAELSAEGLAVLGARNSCDREPIHLSGAVQPHGFLLVVDPISLRVLAASENTPRLPPGCSSAGVPLADLVGPEVAAAAADLAPEANPHDALPVPVTVLLQDGSAARYDLLAHLVDLAWVLEFERSKEAGSRVSARFFQRQRDAVRTLQSLEDVDAICKMTVEEIRKLTGYDRVMIYRFDDDDDGHGQVVAETRRVDLEPYLGLHYPASDIPRQARALYLRNWIRVIVDVDYRPIPIRALVEDLRPHQIDIGMAVLRSVSPVHLQYLRNMGVGATMTISLVADNQLWGMIACHHSTPRYIDHNQRLACEALGQLVSVRLRAVELAAESAYAQSLRALTAQVVTAMAAAENPPAGAVAASAALLGITAADGVVVELDRVRVSAGLVPEQAALQLLISALAAQAGVGPGPFATSALSAVVDLPTGPGRVGGALYLPLGGRGTGFVLWLRQEQAATVSWAGDAAKPDDDDPVPGGAPAVTVRADDAGQAALPPHALAPRTSFEAWREEVRGRSLSWRAAEITAATELAQAMPEVMMHRAQNRLLRLALHDPLTGLPNRIQLQERLDDLLDVQGNSSWRQASHHQVGVLFLDIDGFKRVNDAEGHSVGDELLVLAARRITTSLRPQDFAARTGGDEFVVVLPIRETLEAVEIGQRIVEAFRRSFVLAGRSPRVISVSVGMTAVLQGTDPVEAMRQADTAMYHAKESGRDRLAVYQPATGVPTGRGQIAAAELRDAIAAGHIRPHYQPIVALRDQPILVGFEALARWHHPGRGVVPPHQFIPLAEESGMINTLGDMMLRQALQQLRRWPDPSLSIAVNVSVRQLVRPGYASEVVGQLVELGIDPSRLCLEITESQVMQNPDLAVKVLAALAAAKVQIAVDDFGTGFSSMAYVRNLPAHILKIDKLFVDGLPGEERDVAVVAATIQLAHALGMRVVAEGVETAEQLQLLRELGTDLAQGYLFGRAVPAEEVVLGDGLFVRG